MKNLTLTDEQLIAVELALSRRIAVLKTCIGYEGHEEYRLKCLKNAESSLELVRAA